MNKSQINFKNIDAQHHNLSQHAYDFLSYIYFKKDTSIALFNKLSEQDKIVVWKQALRQKQAQFQHKSVDSLFMKDLDSLEKEKDFFKDYIMPLQNSSYQYAEISWFIKNMSNQWLLPSTTTHIDNHQQALETSIFDTIFPIVLNQKKGSSYQKTIETFIEKLDSLYSEQFIDVIQQRIKIKPYHEQMGFLNMCFRYCKKENVSALYNAYNSFVTEEDKAILGWTLFCYRNDDIINDYKDWIVLAVNKNIDNKYAALELGRNPSFHKLKLFYELYPFFNQNYILEFSDLMLTQNFLAKDNKSLIPTLLKTREDNIGYISQATLIFLLWRAANVMKKEDGLDVLSQVVQHTIKTNEYNWLKDVLHSDTIIKFSHVSMHTKHNSMNELLQHFLYLELSEELVHKPSMRRNKI